jgi:hypothetical protein
MGSRQPFAGLPHKAKRPNIAGMGRKDGAAQGRAAPSGFRFKGVPQGVL